MNQWLLIALVLNCLPDRRKKPVFKNTGFGLKYQDSASAQAK